MQILSITIRLHAPWVHSLKEKRMQIKSICTKIRSKFNVSIAETDEQDIHQIIVISIAAISANTAQSDSIFENILNFIENNSEAEITNIKKEIF